MDNVCHTLVGAALAETGLKHRTRYGAAALMIAANMPDVDVLVFATSTPSVSFRRGWTHGLLAQALLPLALAGLLCFGIVGGLEPGARSLEPGSRAACRLVLAASALGYLGIYSHVFLDYLNNYGVRLLNPVRLALALWRRRVHHRPVAVDHAGTGRVAGAPAASSRARRWWHWASRPSTSPACWRWRRTRAVTSSASGRRAPASRRAR